MPLESEPQISRPECVSEQDYARFVRNAPAALARTDSEHVREELAEALRLIVSGAIPIIGLFWWNWSPQVMLVFVFGDLWLGIISDLIKFVFLRKGAAAFHSARQDDQHVWNVFRAVRNRKSPVVSWYEEWSNGDLAFELFFKDLLAGAGWTWIIYAFLSESTVRFHVFADPRLRLALGGMAVLRLAMTVWEVSSHLSTRGVQPVPESRRFAVAKRPVVTHAGLRFYLMFAFLMILLVAAGFTDPNAQMRKAKLPQALEWALLVFNGLIIAWGIFALSQILRLRREAQWLRKYLEWQQT